MRLIVPSLACLYAFAAPLRAAEVTLSQDDASFQVSNGTLHATIAKRSGKVTSVELDGRKLLGGGSGYWSMSASSGRSRVDGFGVSREQFVSIDPASNGGERAEVVCRFHGTGRDGAYPGNAEIRYAVDGESNTLYASVMMEHGAEDASFRVGEARFVIKMDPEIFDQLTVDKDRNWIMPTGRDWDQGHELNVKEARRMTTGIHEGWAEHKYSYSAMLGEVPAYGWVGSKKPFGVWMVNPSVEYLAGGPTKMELTGHLDVGGDALPTLLNMWHGSHYGGTVLSLEQGEKWTKVIGPFGIHFNQGGSPAELQEKACQQAAVEQAAWPYDWVRHADYPIPAARGGVSGKILISEPRAVSPSSGTLWVGLTSPDYELKGRWGRSEVGWQRDGRNYQYWVRARADGSFSLNGVRPGNYVMRAFADGVLGEFSQPDVSVAAGPVKTMGDILWTPDRAGPTLWEIGIPDRSAAEFRNGDRYWHWGNYLKFKTDFPDGVDYVVGKSDWRKDWHICQPLDLSEDCEVLGDSTWKVRFPLSRVPQGGTRLRVSFCGSRAGSKLQILCNDSEIAGLELPEDGTMHRDSHRGMWFEHSLDIPAEQLRKGENVLQFRLNGRVWHQGVLYDYIRMESVEAPAASPEILLEDGDAPASS